MIRRIEDQADLLWEAALGDDWPGARAALDAVKQSIDALRARGLEADYVREGGRIGALYAARHRLAITVAEAEIAIAAQTAPELMLYANRLTLAAADLTAEITPSLDHDAAMFAFLARELRYARAARNAPMYTETRAELGDLWGRMRPRLLARGEERSAERVDMTLAKLPGSPYGDRETIAALVAESNALRAGISDDQ